jgi:methanogenic corrinoid protein MtbC1
MEKTKDDVLFRIRKSIKEFDEKEIKSAVTEGIDKGIDPVILAEEGCIAAMREVGDMFESDEILLLQVLAASRAMKAGMEILALKLKKRMLNSSIMIKPLSALKRDEDSIRKSILEVMLMVNDFDVIELTENESIIDFIEKDTTLNIPTDCKRQLDEVIHSHPEAAILQLCNS